MPLGDMNYPVPDDRMVVFCLHCNKPQEVARRALSITCKHCNKALKLEDIKIDKYDARRAIETIGMVTIEKRGEAIIQGRIICGGLVVRGKIKGNITARGAVLVGPEAEIRGDVTAPRLAVGAGAVLAGKYDIRPTNLPHASRM